MGALLAQVSRGAQRVSISLAVLKLTGIHQGAILFSPDSPGSLAVPQPNSPSSVKGLCNNATLHLAWQVYQHTSSCNPSSVKIAEHSGT